ncbi:MAG: class I SAM-dependent methyltransferase, partial [Chitinophagaceae bacterium]
KLTSYAKIQAIISSIIRSRAYLNKLKKSNTLKLLNIGCGPYANPEFINLDYSWNPSINICWDIAKKPYPLASSSMEGIFTEHCLEHIEMNYTLENFREFYRLLKPGGVVRIVVPDGEIYLDIYQRRKDGLTEQMPYEKGYISPMARINGIFRNHGHKFIYDFDTMKKLLQEAGFTNIKKCSYRTGSDQRLLIDQDWRAIESLYVEAIK